ncbi:UBC-like protein [Cantharellus anzutake]|uniref:UBC-like protein n=1 Tax=Cantharellus anzutake TaxID=1750568 RepID=UPI0019057638|nr:UBC-like protein [Cantharellus anzutake]KAF8325875.1 UBC-like protein [Cantharellus anzutake]
MASKAASKRLSKEYVAMQTSPPPFVWAAPEEKNILTWHYLIRGPPDSPYAGGEYHGVLLFPSEYPFKPPGIKMFTPSGRFQPNKKICFSMSDFHPGSWNPAWSVATILTGLLSFMLSDEMTTGSVTSEDKDKRILAARSHEWNRKQRGFVEMFPDYANEEMKDLPNMGERDRGDFPGKSQTPTVVQSPLPRTPLPQMRTASPSPVPQPPASDDVPKSSASVIKGNAPDQPPLGWAASWKDAAWNRWRWGILIALAVVVSRLSSI